MPEDKKSIAAQPPRAELSGRQQIKIEILRLGFPGFAAYARAKGWYPQQLNAALSGDRTYPHILDTIAEDTGKGREWVDARIPRKEAA